MLRSTELRGYALTISEATGVTDPAELASIEEVMRQDIFHSTLDWQTKAQLQEAAREAVEMLVILRDPEALARVLGEAA